MHRLLLLVGLAGCGDVPTEVVVPPEPHEAVTVDPEIRAFADWLAASGAPSPDAVGFYQAVPGPVWTTRRGPSARGIALLSALAHAHRDGLAPEDYCASALVARVARVTELERPDRFALELALTETALAYAADRARGRVAPVDAGVPDLPRREVDASALLADGVDDLSRLDPPHPEYAALRLQLDRYRRLHGAPWADLPRMRLEPGDTADAAHLRALERRLADEGWLDEAVIPVFAGPHDLRYDWRLSEAVRRFQEAHGLAPDGVVGGGTLDELRVPPEVRADQIALAMERWRWLPADLGERHVRVNTAAYALEVWEGGRRVDAMRVIVGQPSWSTPMLADRVERVVVNPWWHVPDKIARLEVWPNEEARPGWIARNDMVVNGHGRVSQRPGPRNPLGRVKLVLGNRHAVYLHDTPNHRLFAATDRAFSHGCIRVSRPVDLAAWVVADDWDRARLDGTIAEGTHEEVDPTREVAVWLLYMTAVPTSAGVAFHQDVYGLDRRLERALAERGS